MSRTAHEASMEAKYNTACIFRTAASSFVFLLFFEISTGIIIIYVLVIIIIKNNK
jgi:hypothetical protein